MKKLLFVLFSFLVFLSFNAHSTEITRHMSGSWFNPDQDGHGLSVEVLANGVGLFYWYVYNPDGTPTFLIAQGDVDGNMIAATAYHVTGMRWGTFDPADKDMTIWGDVQLTFQDCNHATLSYLGQSTNQSIPHGGGEIPLIRLVSIEYLQCIENPFAGLYEGLVERDQSGVRHRAKILVDADNRYAVFVEGTFMAFGDFGEPNVDEVWSDNAIIFPLAPQQAPLGAADFSVRVSPGSRMGLSYSTYGPYGFGSGDLVALDHAFRRGVNFGAIGRHESIDRRYTLLDLNSEDRAGIEISLTGAFSGTSDQSTCNWAGQVSIPNPSFNLLEVIIDVTNCGAMDGSYTGYGYNADGQEYYSDRVVYLYTRSETNPMALVLVPRD